MATLTTQVINRAGVTLTFGAAAGGGDAMSCGSGMFLYVKNGGGGSINVTLAVPSGTAPLPNLPVGNLVVAVANGSEKCIGPVQAQFFQDPVTGLCTITYSGVTTVTVASIQLSSP